MTVSVNVVGTFDVNKSSEILKSVANAQAYFDSLIGDAIVEGRKIREGIMNHETYVVNGARCRNYFSHLELDFASGKTTFSMQTKENWCAAAWLHYAASHKQPNPEQLERELIELLRKTPPTKANTEEYPQAVQRFVESSEGVAAMIQQSQRLASVLNASRNYPGALVGTYVPGVSVYIGDDDVGRLHIEVLTEDETIRFSNKAEFHLWLFTNYRLG